MCSVTFHRCLSYELRHAIWICMVLGLCTCDSHPYSSQFATYNLHWFCQDHSTVTLKNRFHQHIINILIITTNICRWYTSSTFITSVHTNLKNRIIYTYISTFAKTSSSKLHAINNILKHSSVKRVKVKKLHLYRSVNVYPLHMNVWLSTLSWTCFFWSCKISLW